MEKERVSLDQLAEKLGITFKEIWSSISYDEGIHHKGIVLYEHIDGDTIDYDLEKSYVEKWTVLQRLSDNKFFKYNYGYSPFRDMHNSSDRALVEVIPQVVTKMIYV